MRTSKVLLSHGPGERVETEVDWETGEFEEDVNIREMRPEVKDKWWRDFAYRCAANEVRERMMDAIPHEVLSRKSSTPRNCLHVGTRVIRFGTVDDANRWSALERAQGRGQGFWQSCSDDGLTVTFTWETDSGD